MDRQTVIISPHADDAIFSLGSFLLAAKNIVIISPFMGIPTDEIGRKKYTTLGKEHNEVCLALGAYQINGSFLDDVYSDLSFSELESWLQIQIAAFQDHDIYIPLGIHHYDHHVTAGMTLRMITELPINSFYVYEELPYRNLYPEEREEKLQKITEKFFTKKISQVKTNSRKESLVRMYKSQVDNKLVGELMTKEYVWRIYQ